MLQAWFDESGSEGTNEVLVLGGFIGKTEDWQAFTEEWAKELAGPPCIKAVKHSHKRIRKPRMQRFLRVLTRHNLTAIACRTRFAPFAKYQKDPELPVVQEAYCHAFFDLLTAIALHLKEIGHTEGIELFFDELARVAPSLQRWYPCYRLILPDDLRLLLPPQIQFRSDAEFLPIQAADLLAGMLRLDAEAPGNDRTWMLLEIKDMPMSNYSQEFDEKRLKRRARANRKLLKQITPEIVEEARRLYGNDEA